MLSVNDLIPYDNHALTRKIIDRVFSGAGHPIMCSDKSKMGYEDFICILYYYFLLYYYI